MQDAREGDEAHPDARAKVVQAARGAVTRLKAMSRMNGTANRASKSHAALSL